MSKQLVFNLEKVREIAFPIEELEGKFHNLEKNSEYYTQLEEDINKTFKDDTNFSLIKDIFNHIQQLNNALLILTKENLTKFLFFQESLIKMYKETFKEDLKKININLNLTKTIGLHLIETKKIVKNVERASFISAISLNNWIEILDSLKFNSLIQSSIKKLDTFFEKTQLQRLELELSKIPKDVDPSIVKDFEQTYLNNPISFQEYIQHIEDRISKEELEHKKKIIEEAKEKEKFVRLKKQQGEQLQSYQDYFKLSAKEFQKKIRKKARGKLTEITEDPKKVKEVSADVLDKISKFKTKFEEKFDDKFLIKKTEDKDPLEVIRERKKLTEEEYKQYLKKFKKTNDE